MPHYLISKDRVTSLWPDRATCRASDHERRAAPACTQLRAVQDGTERAALTFFPPPSSLLPSLRFPPSDRRTPPTSPPISPILPHCSLFAAIADHRASPSLFSSSPIWPREFNTTETSPALSLSLSLSVVLSLSVTAASAPPSSSSHRLRLCLPAAISLLPPPTVRVQAALPLLLRALPFPPLRHSLFVIVILMTSNPFPCSSASSFQSPNAIAALCPSASVTKKNAVVAPLVFSSSHHCSSRLLFLSTSDYYLDHRRRLPSLFLSPAPPSASRHHLPPSFAADT